MARVRTGPRGHELLDRSIGEAAARIDGLSALGRLSALRVPGIDAGAVAVGAGPIERRQATPEELAAIAARDSRPPVLPVRAKAAPAPQCPHVWGPRTGAGRMHTLAIAEGWVEVVCVRCGADYDAPPTPAAPHPEEEPMPTPAPPPEPIRRDGAPPVADELRRRYIGVLIDMLGGSDTAWPELADRIERLLEIGEHGAAAAPEPIRREHGGESWRTPAQQTSDQVQASRQRGAEATKAIHAARRQAKAGLSQTSRGDNMAVLPRDPAERRRLAIEAVAATGTTREAGLRLGVTGTRVQQLLREARAAGELPPEIERLLVARQSGRTMHLEDLPAAPAVAS